MAQVAPLAPSGQVASAFHPEHFGRNERVRIKIVRYPIAVGVGPGGIGSQLEFLQVSQAVAVLVRLAGIGIDVVGLAR